MSKKLYSVDVKVYATAYIRASSAEEANKIARDMFEHDEIRLDHEMVSDAPFDSPELHDVSLSPVATIGVPVGPARRV